MHLLVNFLSPDGAQAMYEALSGRLLYNPVNTEIDDTHPATCAIGQHQDLWSTLRGEATFILRRVGDMADKKAGPPTIHVNLSRRRLVIGREEDCDVMLRRAHVSKHHATVAIAQSPGKGWILTIQDTSANGTWVNRKRLRPKAVTELHAGDRMTFLPESHELYKDALMYEVATSLEAAMSVAEQASDNGRKDALVRQTVLARPETRKRGRESLTAEIVLGDTQRQRSRSNPNPDRQLSSRQRSRSNPNPDRHTQRKAPLANVHLAQPVDIEIQDTGIVAENGVVEVADGNVDIADEETAPQKCSDGGTSDAIGASGNRTEDVGDWVRSLDGGSVAAHESTLVSLFDNVSQIRELYADRLSDFFADTNIQDANHRLAFATALKQLRLHRK
jgi:pSer/pThr/pTyr-binding forkhead associated (FHA) protein